MRGDGDAATMHAIAVQKVNPKSVLPQFVRGRVAYDAGSYEDALAAFKEAAAAIAKNENVSNGPNASNDPNDQLAELHLYLGNSYARLDQSMSAEAEYREELSEFPEDIVAMIAERTDGIPLFAEELSKALIDAGEERARKTVLAAELHVPDTLQASLLARLDHLGTDARGSPPLGAVRDSRQRWPDATLCGSRR